MTTNHRPQLESKRGRDIAIKNTIQHARSQPGQTKLKIRSDLTGAQIGERTGKRALAELNEGNKKPKLLDLSNSPAETAEDEPPADSAKVGSREDTNSNTEIDPKTSNIEHNVSENDSENNSNNSADEDSESESDEDTEALLAELAKTRDENKAHREAVPAKSKDSGAKRSWRSKTSFSRKTENTEKFTTDIMKSKAHQKFLSDFIR